MYIQKNFQFRILPNVKEIVWAIRTTALVDSPLWRGRPLFKNGVVYTPTGITREMQQPYQGGNQWLNFSGFHFGGESFNICRVTRQSMVMIEDISTFFRVSLKQYHEKQTDHYFYCWSSTPFPDSIEMGGNETRILDFYLDFTSLPFPVEVFIWEIFDNVVSIRNRDVQMAIQIEV